jgi:nucleotide-binding universal stress UspA family protein
MEKLNFDPGKLQMPVLVSKNREPIVNTLVDYLSWYHVKVNIVRLDEKAKSVGDAMLKVCSDVKADFLIVGGFSHARARELLFGGVTRQLLMNSYVVTIMVH